MIKLIYCINRLPQLSVEKFQDYWLNTHGPIAGAIKGVKRYVQCHTLSETYTDGRQPPFDGCAQLWWEDADAMRAASGSDEVRAALAKGTDVARRTAAATMVEVRSALRLDYLNP